MKVCTIKMILKRLTFANLNEIYKLTENSIIYNPLWAPLAKWHKDVVEIVHTNFCGPVLKKNLSIAYVDENSGDYLGMTLLHAKRKGFTEDTDKAEEDMWSKMEQKTDGKSAALKDFIFRLRSKVNIFEKYGIDKILQANQLSVHPKYGHKGMATKVMQSSLDVAKENGIPLVAATTASMYVDRSLQKLNIDVIAELRYDSYRYKGEVIFTPEMMAAGHKSFKNVIKLV